MTITHPGMLTEDEFLEHYGVKGMKWGVLREQAAAGDRGAQKKLEKADEQMKAYNRTAAAWVEVNNLVADKMNGPFGIIAKHNADPKYAGIKDYRDQSDPKVLAYFQDFEKKSTKVWAETIKELNPESPSGKFTCVIKEDANGLSYAEMVETATLQHADTNSIKIRVLRDSIGRIVGLGEILSDDAIQHSTKKGSIMSNDNTPDTLTHGMMSEDEFLAHINATPDMTEDEFLEHFGVKGMKWGQTRSGMTLPNGQTVATRSDRRAMDKASKKADTAANNSAIDAARGRIASGKNAQAYKDAKAQYKMEKLVIGKREAAKAFQKVKDKNIADYDKSSEKKSGRETVMAVLGAVAATAAIVAFKAATS